MKASRMNAQLAQLEEIDLVLDEQDKEEISTFLKDNKAEILDNQCLAEKPVETAISTSEPFIENVPDACFRNINFTMNDSMYIML